MLKYLQAHTAILSHLPSDAIAWYKKNIMIDGLQREKFKHGGQSEDKQWHVARKYRIGGTQSGSWMGWPYPYNPSKGKYHSGKTVRATLKEILWSSFQGNAATDYGHTHEPVAQQCLEEFLRTVVFADARSITFLYPGALVIPEYDFLCASVDGIARVEHADGRIEMVLMEIKCPYSQAYDDIPPAYFSQLQFYLGGLRLLGGEYASLKRGFFTVWSETNVKIAEVASADIWFMEVMLPTLMHAYATYLLPLFILQECGLLEQGHVQLMSKLNIPNPKTSTDPLSAVTSPPVVSLRSLFPIKPKPNLLTPQVFAQPPPATTVKPLFLNPSSSPRGEKRKAEDVLPTAAKRLA